MGKHSYIAEVLACCILCSITLFVSSHRFVNGEVTPKWLGLMSGIGVAGIAWSILNQKKLLSMMQPVILLLCCFSVVFIRNWVTFGFNPSLLMYLSGLMLLLFLIQYTVMVCPYRYLFGIGIVFTLALSVQGIFQFARIISSGTGIFPVTGSFDNPAGFASALSCALPLCFLFFKKNQKSNRTCERNDVKIENNFRYVAIATAAIMVVAVFLSGSRAGILAMVAAIAVWVLAKSKIFSSAEPIKNQKSKIILAVVLLALPIVLYFFKKDSADGRLLIWRCTWDMFSDRPLWGHGQGAFQAKYMLYQADYFTVHPDSRFESLADNTLHPFNEYLLVLCEHGLAGLGLLTLSGFFLICVYRRNPGDEKLPALMSLSALAVFSFFSYPFRYPFTWVLLFLNAAVICNPGRDAARRVSTKSIMFRTIVFVLSAALLTYSVLLTRAETKWNRIAHLSLAGKTGEILPEYDKLYPYLSRNGLFLYNHAAELHEVKEYERSITVFERCTRYYNDMDVQMLLADNYKELEQYAEAERHLKTAAGMCPARFMPLYELAKLYETANRKDEALALAKRIIDKDVKVLSPTVTAIKNEMRQLAEERNQINEDICDSATQGRTSDEP